MSASQWVILAIICGTVEIFTVGFWFLWLSLSALLVALGVSLGWMSTIESQLLVFAFLTLIFIIFTRPLVLKLIHTNDTVSNVNALIGQHGVVTNQISPLQYGQIKLNGEIWTAAAAQEIETGARVKVIAIDGVKLVVESAQSEV
ncbi:MAG: NfeD family protein [Bacillota bacterium]|nr:NfeD family protein [Bacillota bacterium]